MKRGFGHRICELDDVVPGTGVCALVEGRQNRRLPASRDASLRHRQLRPCKAKQMYCHVGLVGDLKGERVVASPIYKHHYSLTTGRLPRGTIPKTVHVHRAKVLDGRIWVKAGGETTRTNLPVLWGSAGGVLRARNVNGTVEIAGDPRAPRQPRCSLLQRLRARGNTRDRRSAASSPD